MPRRRTRSVGIPKISAGTGAPSRVVRENGFPPTLQTGEKKKGGASDPAGASCHGSAGQGQGDRTPGVSQRPHLTSGFAERWGPPDTVPDVQMPCQRARTFAEADLGWLGVGGGLAEISIFGSENQHWARLGAGFFFLGREGRKGSRQPPAAASGALHSDTVRRRMRRAEASGGVDPGAVLRGADRAFHRGTFPTAGSLVDDFFRGRL